MIGAGPPKKPPETEVEILVAAKNDAAAEARRQEIAAERAKLMAEREERLKALPKLVPSNVSVTPPAKVAASAIHEALGDRWPNVDALLRQWRPADLMAALLDFAAVAEAQSRKASAAAASADRAAAREADAIAREGRKAAVLAEVTGEAV